MKDWTECEGCGEEFKVICSSVLTVQYCPLCGSEVEPMDVDDEEEDE